MTERVLGRDGASDVAYASRTFTALAASAFTVLFVAASGATLAGSTFESGDGNLALDAGGTETRDWNVPVETIDCVAPGLSNCAIDLVKNAADNSRAGLQGDVAPAVVTGSIPPSRTT